MVSLYLLWFCLGVFIVLILIFLIKLDFSKFWWFLTMGSSWLESLSQSLSISAIFVYRTLTPKMVVEQLPVLVTIGLTDCWKRVKTSDWNCCRSLVKHLIYTSGPLPDNLIYHLPAWSNYESSSTWNVFGAMLLALGFSSFRIS